MNAALLLIVAVIATAVPDRLADLLGHSRAAWFYIMHGVEATALWIIIGAAAHPAVQAVSAYGAMEGAMRAMCRLALPMDRAPNLPAGQNICDVAFGVPATWLSIGAALFVAIFAQELSNARIDGPR
jgi:hypothetical protein